MVLVVFAKTLVRLDLICAGETSQFVSSLLFHIASSFYHLYVLYVMSKLVYGHFCHGQFPLLSIFMTNVAI